MAHPRSRPLVALCIAATLFLAACESSEEKAEGFYQSGLALLAEGDTARAAIEFRNVFRYNGEHKDARLQLAQIMEGQGRFSAAYSQYLRLAEQYPQDADVRRALALIALQQREWSEAERHGRLAIEAAPGTEATAIIETALDYRNAVLEEDGAARGQLAQTARSILENDPENMVMRRIVIDEALSGTNPSAALPDIEMAIELEPENLDYGILKLRLLTGMGQEEEIAPFLQTLYQRFPDNTDVQRTLISWYLSRRDFSGAEEFLRELAGPKTAAPEGHLTVLRLVEEAKGRDAVLAELNALIEANAENPENQAIYRATRAGYDFQDGQTAEAIAQMQEIIASLEPSAEQRRIKGVLTRMLLSDGNRVGARALIEEVLAEDQSDVTALKLRGAMLIDNDQPRDAILDLRSVLDQDPRDLEAILLLSEAHERDGNTDLQGERLAAAVDVSASAPEPSLRYASFLVGQDRRGAARSVLADARKTAPGNVDILRASARLALEDNALGLVRGIIGDLRLIDDDPAATELASSLETAVLLRQGRIDDGLSQLEQRAVEGEGDLSAIIAIIRTRIRAGRVEDARQYLDATLAELPDSPQLRMIDAGLSATEGDFDRSEEILRGVLAENPESSAAVRQLYGLLRGLGKFDEATELLTAGLEQQPTSRILRLLNAVEMEERGEFDAAIAIYEEMYAENSSDTVVANNLATVLSSYTDDPESLERASIVARRLSGTQVPAFQDTYGWIAYREGRFDEAVEYLEQAAEGLPQNALVVSHLGIAYAAAGQTDAAIETLTRAVELAGDNAQPAFEQAREKLAELTASAAEPEAEPETEAAPEN